MRRLFFLLLVCLPFGSFSQGIPEFPTHQIGLSYFGEAYSHPGAILSYEHAWKSKLKEKTNRKGVVKDRRLGLLWGARAGFYNYPRNHIGIFITPTITVSRVNIKGGFYEIGVHAGTMTKILNAPVFNPSTPSFAGNEIPRYLYFLGGLHFGVGRDFSVKHPKLPFKWRLGSSIFLSAPHSTSFIWQSAIELGLIWKIG